MANTLTLQGVGHYDGDYEFEFDGFTNREYRRIKLLTGLRAGELEDAFEAGDNDALVALAIVIVERHGKKVDADTFWDAEGGGINFAFAGDEEDPTTPPSSGSDAASSGDASTSSSEASPSDPNGTGTPASQRSAISLHEISAS